MKWVELVHCTSDCPGFFVGHTYSSDKNFIGMQEGSKVKPQPSTLQAYWPWKPAELNFFFSLSTMQFMIGLSTLLQGVFNSAPLTYIGLTVHWDTPVRETCRVCSFSTPQTQPLQSDLCRVNRGLGNNPTTQQHRGLFNGHTRPTSAKHPGSIPFRSTCMYGLNKFCKTGDQHLCSVALNFAMQV